MPIPLTRAPLVGRTTYLTQLYSAWQHAAQGKPFACVVTGEPGSGKTRLVDEFAAALIEAQVRVVRGGSVEADNAPPYLPLLDAFTPLVEHTTVEALTTMERALLTTLFPQVAASTPPSASTSSPDQTRWQLYEAFTVWIRHIATQQPLVLILDDVQWTDRATLGLLLHTLQRLNGVPFLLLLGSRADGPAQNAELQRLLVELNRTRQLLSLTLTPLTIEETGQLADHILGRTISVTVAEGIYRQSEGNPFFTEELIAHWQEIGVLAIAQQGVIFAVPEAERSLPPTILATVQQRVTRFSQEIQDALTAAALIGRTFDIHLLGAVLEQPPALVEQWIVEPVQAQLVKHTFGNHYAFVHDTVREALRAMLLPLQLQALHRTIGQRLAESTPDTPPAVLTELAYHAAHGGNHAQGILYALRAADAALGQYAFKDAAHAYALALSLIDTADGQGGEILLKQGEALLYAGETEQGIVCFQQAADHFLKTAALTDYADALYRLGMAYWRVERLTDAKSAFEQALTSVGDALLPLKASLLSDYAALLGISFHRLSPGIDAATEARQIAMLLEDEPLVAKTTRILGVLLARANQLDEGIRLLSDALALATSEGDKREEIECRAALTMPYFWSVRAREGHTNRTQQLRLAHESHDPFQLRHVYSEMGIFAGLSGNIEEAEMYFNQAETVVRDLQNPEAEGYLAMCRGALAYFRGDLPATEAYFEQMLEHFAGIGDMAMVWYIGLMGIAKARLGHIAQAREIATRMENLLQTLPHPSMPAAELMCHLAMLAIALEDRTLLLTLAPRLDPYRGQYHDVLVDRLLAAVAMYRQDWSATHTLMNSAEQTARTRGLPLELAQVLTQRIEAELLEHHRITEIATQAATEAMGLYRQWGNDTEVGRITRLLESSPPPSTTTTGLTTRELEVLRLVAQGKSNRDIAATLYLSEKTVERHLTSIFNKTTTDNRAAAAAFAVKQGLV